MMKIVMTKPEVGMTRLRGSMNLERMILVIMKVNLILGGSKCPECDISNILDWSQLKAERKYEKIQQEVEDNKEEEGYKDSEEEGDTGASNDNFGSNGESVGGILNAYII